MWCLCERTLGDQFVKANFVINDEKLTSNSDVMCRKVSMRRLVKSLPLAFASGMTILTVQSVQAQIISEQSEELSQITEATGTAPVETKLIPVSTRTFSSIASNSPKTKILELSNLLPVSADATNLMTQDTPTNDRVIEIIGIKLEPTTTGVEVRLQTASGETLKSVTQVEGNTLIADIKDAVLALPEGQSFSQENPAAGINEVTVTQVESTRIQIRVTGAEAAPAANVVADSEGLVLAVTPIGEEVEIEITVTAETAQEVYTVPDASTATRTDTLILDTPQSVQVLPQEILQDQQILRVDDALQNVSGIVGRLDSFGSATNLTIRGFTTETLTGGAILRDGFRITNTFGTQETANLERIEVIKGPSSVLYGQNDPGGIVNLVTKQPLSEPFYELEFQAGNLGTWRPRLDITGPITKDKSLSYRLNLAYLRKDGFRDFEIDTERFFVAPTLRWDISDRTNLTLRLEYIDETNPFDLGIPAFGTGIFDVPRDRTINEPDDFISNRSLTLGYDFVHQFSDDWKLNHGFRYVTQDYSNLTTLPFRVDEVTGNTIRFFGDRVYNSDDYTIQTNLEGNFKTGSLQHKLLVGVDLNFNRFDDVFSRIDTGTPTLLNIFNPVYGAVSRPDLSTVPPFPAFDTETDRIGVFIQDQISFLDKFILVGSLRYDSVDFRNLVTVADSRSDQALSPRIGFIYKPIETVSLYANYSESFTPSFGQVASGGSVDPERASGFEVGIKSEFLDGNMFATLSYFDITKRNVATTDPNNPFFFVATGKQRSQGIELDVAGEILPGWNVIANYAYTNARVTEDNDIPVGNRLFNAPLHSAGLWTTYEIQKGDLEGLGFGLGFNYVGDRFGDLTNTFRAGDYFLANVALFYKRDNWRFGLNFNNIFNVEYITSTNNSRNFGNAPGAPFTILGSVSVSFWCHLSKCYF